MMMVGGEYLGIHSTVRDDQFLQGNVIGKSDDISNSSKAGRTQKLDADD